MTTRGPDTRTRLIETAAELIWQRSFHSTGVDDICQRAGALRGSFYHFFPSKTDLAIEAVRQSWKRVREEIFEPAFQDAGSGLKRLSGLVAAVDRFQRAEHQRLGVYLGCPFGSLGQEMAHQDGRVQTAVDEVFDGHLDYFRRALEQAAEEGEIEPGDLDRRARSVLAVLEGAMLLAKVANSPERFTEAARALPLVAARDPATVPPERGKRRVARKGSGARGRRARPAKSP